MAKPKTIGKSAPAKVRSLGKTSRPAPSDAERERIAAARERARTRRVPARVEVIRKEGQKVDLEAPHDDGHGWLDRLQDAFGTGSDEFAYRQLTYLAGMVRADDPSPGLSLNGMIATAGSLQPENEAEGALAVQMAATHHLAMVCLSRAATSGALPQMEANGTLATKMLRTYTTQLEALAKLRRKGEQKVRVEHVTIEAGGQAIVGHVTTGEGGGYGGNGHQPHALTDAAAHAFSPGAPLLCADAAGNGVSVAEGEGEAPLPDARRREG